MHLSSARPLWLPAFPARIQHVDACVYLSTPPHQAEVQCSQAECGEIPITPPCMKPFPPPTPAAKYKGMQVAACELPSDTRPRLRPFVLSLGSVGWFIPTLVNLPGESGSYIIWAVRISAPLTIASTQNQATHSSSYSGPSTPHIHIPPSPRRQSPNSASAPSPHCRLQQTPTMCQYKLQIFTCGDSYITREKPCATGYPPSCNTFEVPLEARHAIDCYACRRNPKRRILPAMARGIYAVR